MINVEKMLEEVRRDFGEGDFNFGKIKVIDFEDSSIKIALQDKYPESFDSEIYHFGYGNYFITDRGWIFSMRTEHVKAEREHDELMDFHIKNMNHRQRELFLKNMAPDDDNKVSDFDTNYYIYKRSSKSQHMRFYIAERYAPIFEAYGYKVTSELSFQKYFNICSGKMEHVMTHSVRLSQDIFKSFCMNDGITRRGKKLVDGVEVDVTSGRPRKTIILVCEDGSELKFDGQQECADYFGICVRSVKRAFKNKGAGDTVKLKKMNFQLLG